MKRTRREALLFLACTPLLGMCTIVADAQEAGDALLRASLADVKRSTGAQTPNLQDPVDAAVLAEFDALLHAVRQVHGFESVTTQLQMTEEVTGAHPTAGIMIGRANIRSWLTNAGITRPREAIRLLLAHEMTHILQYKIYGLDAVLSQYPENRRIFEAQADMLAGRYLTLTSTDGAASLDRTMGEASLLLFDLGDPEIGAAFHPSKEKRRTAVRYGMTMGLAVRDLNDIDGAVRASGRRLLDNLSYGPSDSPFSWSFLESKKVVHFGSDVLQDFDAVADPQCSLFTSGGNSFIRFRLSYKFTGSMTSHILLNVDCLSSLDGHGSLSPLSSSQAYNFWINPGEGKVLAGVLVAPGTASASSPCDLLRYWPQSESMTAGQLF